MKGIILAGGTGTRLYPLTISTSKQLLPIYDKPMIYYPLSILLLANIRDILIISTPDDTPRYQKLLGDGSQFGVKLEYKIQDKPRGLADAFILGESFIGDDSVCLVLGDNVFYGHGITELLQDASKMKQGGIVFGYPVADPREFGVVEFDENMKAVSFEEKPKNPKSQYAVPGLYFFDKQVSEIAKKVVPSERGELEITSIINEYLKMGKLKVLQMQRGIAWLDTGNPANMLAASSFIEAVQKRQGLYVACLEEIAWRKGFIGTDELLDRGEKLKKTDYGKYLISLARGANK